MGLWYEFKNLFKKKRTIKVNFYDEAGKIITRTIKYTNNTFETKFYGEVHTYIIDHAFVNYDAKDNTPMSSYYIGNPRPIRFLHERNEDLDSVGFKSVIDSKVVKDLFKEEDKIKMLLIIVLICICIAVSLFTLAKVMGWIK